MKKIIVTLIFISSANLIYAATINGTKRSDSNVSNQINEKIRHADKMNNINGNLNKYNGNNPSDTRDFNKYQQDKSAETFKR